MDMNSTAPWSAEWDWLGAVQWGSTLVDMGTYPGTSPLVESNTAVPAVVTS